MDLKCHCLNVTVSIQPDSSRNNVDVEALRQDGQPDMFDGCCLREADMDVGGISLEHVSLVSEKLYGDLRVFKCHGCALITHASHQHKAGRLFVNGELIHDSSRINELRQSSGYSEVFHIVLPADYDSAYPDVVLLQRKLGSSVSHAQQILESFILAEEASVQAKIQAFMDEQKLVLTRIKQKAQQDLRSLYGVMSSIPVEGNVQSKAEASPATHHISAERPDNKSVFPAYHNFDHSSGMAIQDAGVFSMDDMECGFHERPAFVSDDDDDDCDTSTDNSFQSSSGAMLMAKPAESTPATTAAYLGKSAPMTMPGRLRGYMDDASDDDFPVPSDIAKSIQAMAQSVQDQSMQLFGDLPRPRTATSFIDTVS